MKRSEGSGGSACTLSHHQSQQGREQFGIDLGPMSVDRFSKQASQRGSPSVLSKLAHLKMQQVDFLLHRVLIVLERQRKYNHD